MTEQHHFSANRIFVILFALTAIEVAWSFFPFPRWALWGGLLIFAFYKGFFIFTYFMHMKYEGWICKALIAPVVPLVGIVLFATMPDVAYNEKLVYPQGSYLDPATGDVVLELPDGAHGDAGHGDEDAGGGGH